MKELYWVTILALFPAFGNFFGGLLASWIPFSKKMVNRSLHAAAGIMLAIVSIEVMPEAMKSAPAWLLAVMFLAGGCFYMFLEEGIKSWQGGSGKTGAWMVYLAVTADLAGDGLLIGSGSAVSGKLALVLALGQVLADIPEGFAVVANFREKGMRLSRRLLLSASFAIPVVIAALFAYYFLKDRGEVVKMSALVFVAGLFSLAAVEDILGEAHETEEDTRWSAISFLSGFSLFMVISGMVP